MKCQPLRERKPLDISIAENEDMEKRMLMDAEREEDGELLAVMVGQKLDGQMEQPNMLLPNRTRG